MIEFRRAFGNHPGGLGDPLPPQTIPDGGDDERRALPRVGVVALGRDRAGGADVALDDLVLPVTGGSVVVGAVVDPHGPTRAEIDLDVPLGVALAEVEAVPVDLALPLLGCVAAVVVDHDARLIGQPRLQVGLVGLWGSVEPLAFGGLPELVHVVDRWVDVRRPPSVRRGCILGVGHSDHLSASSRARAARSRCAVTTAPSASRRR